MAAAAAILYPVLVRPAKPPAAPEAARTPVQELLDRRDSLVRALIALESERAAGKVAEEEYRRQRDGYERQAAAVLKALDLRAVGLAEQIEEEVAGARKRPAPALEQEETAPPRPSP